METDLEIHLIFSYFMKKEKKNQLKTSLEKEVFFPIPMLCLHRRSKANTQKNFFI
jgi:hypothetical protein